MKNESQASGEADSAVDSLRNQIAQADLVCFDNDGTLFRSDEVANPAIQRVFGEFMGEHGLDYPEPTDERILELTGTPGPYFYREILPTEVQEHAEEFRSRCVHAEAEEIAVRGRFFDGIEELLLGLKTAGKKLALVSNGGTVYIGACERRLDYDRLLDAVYHYGKYGLLTKADMITAARDRLGATRPVMVGDRGSDLEGAEGAGVPFVGCQFGYASESEIDHTPILARSVDELRAVLLPSGPVA